MTRLAIRLLALAFLVPGAAFAAGVTLNHTGYALDGSDQPIDGSRNMRFRIYATEGATSASWDSGATACSVAIRAGYYRISLGDECGTGLTSAVFPAGATRWLELEIAGTVLSPRSRVDTIPAAAEATHALDADTLGSKSLAQIVANDLDPLYAHLAGAETIAGAKTFTSALTVAPSGASTVVGGGTLNVGNNVYVGANGRMGIGTATPGESLETTGNVKAAAFYGSGANLTSLPAANLTGSITNAQITSIDWTKVTNAPAGGTITLTAGESISAGQAVRVSDGTNAETAGRAYRAQVLASVGTAEISDDFTRANSTTVGNGWTETENNSTNFQVLNNVMLMQGSAGAATNTVMYRALSRQNAMQLRFQLLWDDGTGGTHRVTFATGNTGAFDSGVGLRFNRDSGTSVTLAITDGTVVKNSTTFPMADAAWYEVELQIKSDWSVDARVWATSGGSRPSSPTVSQAAFTPANAGGSNVAIFRTQSSNTRNVNIDAFVAAPLQAIVGGEYVGVAQASAASGASATIVYAGLATGLSGLSPGKRYYVGSTAGALVATPPTDGTIAAGIAVSSSSLLVRP